MNHRAARPDEREAHGGTDEESALAAGGFHGC
jgi:hypothetical protein